MRRFDAGPRLRAMSRWLLVLIALLLPLQLAWAGVAAYCGDSHELAVAHGLHHQHEQADASGDEPAAPDCGHCHGHVSALPLRLPSLQATDARQQAQVLPSPPFSGLAPPRPERPQWQYLA